MAKTSYVINVRTGLVQHVGTRESCDAYVFNSTALFAAGPFEIATGAAERDNVQRSVKARIAGRKAWEAYTTD